MEKFYTEQDVEADLSGKMASSLQEELDLATANGDPCTPRLLPVFKAGHWLGKKLEENGVKKDERSSICFALGQRIRMVGINNSYREAIASFKRWKEGNPDRGGLKFGLELIK